MLDNLLKWFTPSRFTVLTLILLIISIFSALPLLDLRMEEPRRALVALEMMLSRNFALPALNGEAYYNKPPVFNWMIALFFKIFGKNEDWIARLPSVLGFFGMAFVNFVMVKKYVNKNIALISSLIFLTAGDIYFYSTIHSAEIDLFYSFIVVCQAMVIFHGYYQKKYLLMFLASYFLMATGTLTKGLPSVAFQVITILAVSLYYKDFKLLFRWQHFAGIGMAILLLVVYFLWYGKYNDPLPFIVRLFTESSEKSVVEKTEIVDIIKSAVVFPFFMFSKIMPWSLLILLPIFLKKRIKQSAKNPLVTFFILFTVSNILLYWLTPGIKIRYVYMFFPFIVTGITYFSYPFFEKIIARKWFYIFLLALNIILAGLFAVAPFLNIMKGLKALYAVTPFVLLLSAFNVSYFVRNPGNWILSFVLLLVILRLELNVTYLPLRQKKDPDYTGFIARVDEITKGENIYFTGKIRKYPLSLSFGPLTIVRDQGRKYTMPPYIYYKIPYYLSVKKQEVIQYHENPLYNKFYISSIEDFDRIKPEKQVYLVSGKESKKYVLFKLTSPAEK